MCPPNLLARSGRKRDVLDIFGTWVPLDSCSVAALRECNLPQPLVDVDDILEFNFDWGANTTLPYETLDNLRVKHNIDVSGLNMSLTRGGNNYRSYVLMRGSVA